MFQILPDDWKQRVADPENPTYLECTALGFHNLKPGKQCAHPGSRWFRNPRPNPPPLPSRTAILTAIFREHTAFDKGCQDVLTNYLPPDDADLLQRERDENAARTFPQFSLLPPEIREQIWELALPRRFFDLREARHQGAYVQIRNYHPPVPYIAQVCREARAVVLRLGTRLYYAWTDEFHDPRWSADAQGDAPVIEVSPVGFFVRGSDIVLHMPDPSAGPELNPNDVAKIKSASEEDGYSATTLTGSTMANALRVHEMAVNWAPSARPANARTYPGSVLPRPWRMLKYAGPGLKTVHVYYRSTFIEISMVMADKFFESRGPLSTEVQLVVDLYDDKRLAELESLETLCLDKDSHGPRFAGSGLRNPGLCLNCERVQWEEHIKPAAVCQWLQLFEGELDELSYQSVFRPGAATGYDVEHPWVKEKLLGAPDFRPVVIILLQATKDVRAGDSAVLD
ncbi:hypothetical protein QBC34DRAFT_100663 [Podospora aff. communis PSN243]|uniref:2EXR domain-containing protein n=1 Tax=Podospora aff. communis PSN243 TaxID=3040156 RepID=A0AAV9GLR5_9PEZI|nr:hypothetical protein QBC34DRAFT_100663 [Podospora aff. communis PSN243]